MSEPKSSSVSQGINSALVFLLCCLWVAVSLAGGRLAAALLPEGDLTEAMRLAITAAMLFAGYYLLGRWAVPDLRPLSSIGFVKRPTSAREFGIGAALGWAGGLALLLPAFLSGNLLVSVHFGVAAAWQSLLAAVLVVGFSLVVQQVVAGLPVRMLVRSIGPAWTTLAVAAIGLVMSLPRRPGDGQGLFYTALLLCMALTGFLRTRAIWLSLGLQAGFMWCLMVLFGTTSPYLPRTPGLVRGEVTGTAWLTGGFSGPETSVFAIPILLLLLILLVRVTRDFAWHYAYQPGAAGGYAVEVQPPAAHAQQAAPAVVSLVQIGGQVQPPAQKNTDPHAL